MPKNDQMKDGNYVSTEVILKNTIASAEQKDVRGLSVKMLQLRLTKFTLFIKCGTVFILQQKDSR